MKKIKIFVCAFIALFSVTQINAQTNPAKDAILIAYYGVKNALITGSASATDTKAGELLTALSSFPADQLSAADKATWTKYFEKLRFDARHISESNDIAHQREHFATLSDNMFNAIKALKVNSAPVYRTYCPMKKMYWLSEYAAIKNPYYGNQMLTCGEVKETLSATK
jgi:hypothetical protein